MTANKSITACITISITMLFFAVRADAIAEQYIAENGLEVLADAIKFFGKCIVLSGFFVGIGLAVGKRK